MRKAEQMDNIQELQDRRILLWETAKDFLEEKRGNNGIVSEKDTAAYDR